MILALGALIALIAALVSGSSWPAFLVIGLAAVGIVLLLRDWRSARAAGGPAADPAGTRADTPALRADEFSPDISTDPGGPSSDARSDQT